MGSTILLHRLTGLSSRAKAGTRGNRPGKILDDQDMGAAIFLQGWHPYSPELLNPCSGDAWQGRPMARATYGKGDADAGCSGGSQNMRAEDLVMDAFA